MMRFITHTPSQTIEVGRTIAACLPERVVVQLLGPLGSGKTTLIQGIVAARGGANVSSPTYVYHQRYETPSGPIDHFDLYRVHQDPALLSRSGIEDFVADLPGILLVEWPTQSLKLSALSPLLTIHASGAPVFSFTLETADLALGARLRSCEMSTQ